MVMKMAIRRYEVTDEQWERVKDMIEHTKMGRPPKDDRLMLNTMLWVGWETFRNDTAHGKWYTADFANGMMMARWFGFFKL